MIIIECEQGSEEWFKARAGVITASNFEECRKRVGGLNLQQRAYVDSILSGCSIEEAMSLAKYKNEPKADVVRRALNGERVGDFSDKAKEYAFRLAIERISGELLSEDKFDTFEMRRGRQLEPEARLAHEMKKGILVEQTGIALTDDRLFGASVDGLIDDDGSSEYKCFIGPSSLMPILLDEDLSKTKDQVQGQLWITGRKWSDFVLYCPALKSIGKELTIITVERDDDYIEALEADMLAFNDLVESYREKLINS